MLLAVAALTVPLTLSGTASAKPPPKVNAITYHGGPVILGTTNVYYIWYGNWPTTSPVRPILTDFASNVGGSPYFNINTTYYSSGNRFVSNSVNFAGQTDDSYSRGTSLSDASVQAVVADAINFGRLPNDTNGVYFVLTSADVAETSGLDTSYCEWHTHATISGSDIKYALVGNPDRAPSACTNGTPPPNGDVGAYGMVNLIAHVLDDTVTDPDLNAWYDTSGLESADKCAWTFGTTYVAPNGGTANVHLGSRDYLIQQNWVNAKRGYCALSYP